MPGDPSSAAFLVGAAVLAEAGELRIAGVGVNPTRTGFLRVLERMGAPIVVEAADTSFGEPVADLIARPAALRRTEVAAAEIPGLIDEIPMLAVLATRAAGETVFRDVGELRVKESDRLGLIAENIRAVGRQRGGAGRRPLRRGGRGTAPRKGAHRRRPPHRHGVRRARHLTRCAVSRWTTWRAPR